MKMSHCKVSYLFEGHCIRGCMRINELVFIYYFHDLIHITGHALDAIYNIFYLQCLLIFYNRMERTCFNQTQT